MSTPSYRPFGEALEALMAERGISQVDLEARSGVSQGLISKYVRGEKLPGEANMVAIARGLGVAAETFREYRAALVHREVDRLLARPEDEAWIRALLYRLRDRELDSPPPE